jgi:hypothetical protein
MEMANLGKRQALISTNAAPSPLSPPPGSAGGANGAKSGKSDKISKAFSSRFVTSTKESVKDKDGNTEKALENKLQIEEQASQDKTSLTERIRLRTKRFLSSSVIGRSYTHLMLMLSVVSCLEFIYQTYLTTHLNFENVELAAFTIFEMVMSGMFAFDWLLSFFIADHKLAFIGRYLCTFSFILV